MLDNYGGYQQHGSYPYFPQLLTHTFRVVMMMAMVVVVMVVVMMVVMVVVMMVVMVVVMMVMMVVMVVVAYVAVFAVFVMMMMCHNSIRFGFRLQNYDKPFATRLQKAFSPTLPAPSLCIKNKNTWQRLAFIDTIFITLQHLDKTCRLL